MSRSNRSLSFLCHSYVQFIQSDSNESCYEFDVTLGILLKQQQHTFLTIFCIMSTDILRCEAETLLKYFQYMET